MAALLFNSLSLVRDTSQRLLLLAKNSVYGASSKSNCHHEVVTQSQIGDRDILIVGDIHGCYDEFEELIGVARESVNGRELYTVCAGDMLNKGPKSKKVLDFLRDLMMRGMASAVKGNHEEAILRQYRLLTKDKHYVLPKRYTYLNEFNQDDFAFIERLPYSVSIPHLNVLVVHAGLVPGVPLERQSCENLCEMRNVEVSITFPWGLVSTAHKKPVRGVAWASAWQGPQHVYFGHDCRRGLQRLPFATGLDTGCVYGDRLTGAILDACSGSARLVSVEAKREHYCGKKQAMSGEQNVEHS
ncbi:hypothetical protein EGW08_016646 [Elysia chlorotica]|uniref:Calcineurin-like phosphoesterase domain-containing protein n=1 Tax=Elysia chlorotica TaxID=188477 RepID=A0A3S1HAU3_ELYCH|nr:hypothetical protein EGW08_016646 [Elysia chlorotica]